MRSYPVKEKHICLEVSEILRYEQIYTQKHTQTSFYFSIRIWKLYYMLIKMMKISVCTSSNSTRKIMSISSYIKVIGCPSVGLSVERYFATV